MIFDICASLNRIKSIISVIIILGFNCNVTFAADDLSYLTIEEKNWLKAHPTLRLGIDTSWPPFDFIDKSNKHRGLAADYIQLLSKQLGISIELQDNLTWGQVLKNAQQRKLDIVSAAQKTPARNQYLLFTTPIVTVPWVIISRKAAPVNKNLAQLQNQTVAMVKDYAIVEIATKKFPDLNIKLVDSPLAGLRAVATGKVNVFVESLGVAGHLIQSHSMTNLTVSNDAGLALQEISIAVRSDWPELLSILNKGLKRLDKSELNKIYHHWVPILETTAADQQQDNSWIWPLVIALGVVVFFLVVAYYFASLRSEQLALKFGSQKYNFYVVIAVCIFITITISATWYGLRINKQNTLSDIQKSLKTVRDTTAESLSIWLKNKKSIVNHISSDDKLVSMVEELIKLPANKQAILSDSVTNDIRAFHREEKDLLGELGFFIINKDNISIGSMRDVNIGSINLISLQKPELLKRVFNGESVFIPPIYSDIQLSKSNIINPTSKPPTMFIASPIRNKVGEIIAAFTIRLDPAKQFSKILHTGRIGETGETYTFDNKGLLLSESRFANELVSIGLLPKNKNSVLSIIVSDPGGNMVKGFKPNTSKKLQLTTMAISAIKGNSEINTNGYRDYRGVNVYGAWTWLTEFEIGLTTEIDAEDGLHAYYTSRNIILVIIGILLVITISTFIFTLIMANRTNRLLQRSHNELESKVYKRTEEIRSKEKNFKDILESSPIGVIVTHDGSIQYANLAATKIIRCEHSELLTMDVYDFYQEPHVRDNLFNEVKAKGFVHNVEVRLKRADEAKGWVLMSLIPTEYEQKPAMLAWFSDITIRKEYEENLAEAKEQAERANEAKSDFLSSMSHELRTPLNAIIGFGQLLEMDAQDEITKRNLSEITSAGHHLLHLITDILDLSAIESGKLSLSIDDVYLKDVFTECLSLIMPLADKRDIRIIAPFSQCVSCHVLADYMRLKQVVLNLLSNAVKYNREGGSITISGESYPDNKLRITVTDTGMGMSGSQLEQLFQEFNRVGAEKTGIEGTGIGLVITKRLVELMGGTIGVESQQGKGTSFWVELNISANSGLDKFEQDEELDKITILDDPENTKKKILYIEDNPSNLRLVSRIIEQYSSYDLISAPDGRLGIDLAISQQPELILLDINLPDQDGYSILKRLQEIDETKNIAVIAVTANAMKSDIDKGNKAGFIDYITKPIEFQKLLEAINKVLD